MAPVSLLSRLLTLILLLCCATTTIASPFPPPRKPSTPPPRDPPLQMPPSNPSDTFPHADIGPNHKIDKAFSKLTYPLFSLNPSDTSHVVAGFPYRGTCTIGVMFQLNSVPRAVRGDDSTLVVAGIASWTKSQRAARRSSDYQNTTTTTESQSQHETRDYDLRTGIPGFSPSASSLDEGKTSACITFDLQGQPVRSLLLKNLAAGQPATQAAMWANSHCSGAPDSCSLTPLGSSKWCISPQPKNKEWRSVRLWYGSQQVTDGMWGEGEESLSARMEGMNSCKGCSVKSGGGSLGQSRSKW